MNLSLVYLLFLIIISRQMYLCLPFTSTKNSTYTIVSQTSLMRNAASALTKTKIGAARAVVWWGERLAGQFEVVVENV